MSNGEFRFIFYARDYEETVAFYRDGLELPAAGGWDHSPEDRSTLFKAASGIIQVIGLPPGSEFTQPVGVSMAIEVADAEEAYRQVSEKGLPVKNELADKTWGHRNFSLIDPTGIEVVLFQVVGNR